MAACAQRSAMPAPHAPPARPGLGWGLALGVASIVMPAQVAWSQSAPTGVEAAAHWRAAEQQAVGAESRKAAFRRACSTRAAPKTAAQALEQLRQAEAAHQAERALPRPRAERLLLATIARGCAAYHATRVQPGSSYPVWWQSQVRIEGVRPAVAGFAIQARAITADGAVANSRMTFARGLHHACFVPTDEAGRATCVMVDTHPHGDRVNGWAEAHEGPFVATLAGMVSTTRVDLPAVEFRDLPAFTTAARWR